MSAQLPNYQQIKKFIEQDDPKSLIEAADIIGQELVTQKLTTSQIRALFGEVRRIKMNWTDDKDREKARQSYRKATLLKPKLGYQAKRMEQKTHGVKTLEDKLVPALDAVIEAPESERKVRFERLTDYFEAIVAYHRKHGGSNN
mgnify:CR=1 FL=1